MKTKKILAILVVAFGLMVWSAKVSEAGLMGTAFTYQGHLYDANHAADGEYDFQFTLYDANEGGSQLAGPIEVNDCDVIDAYFTVELDFGCEVFDGNAVWLETTVAHGDGSDPCTLSPRQEVTPVPYALQTRGIFVTDEGKVGIGTINPSYKLEIYSQNSAGLLKLSSNVSNTQITLDDGGEDDVYLTTGASGSGAFDIWTGGNNRRLTVLSDGKVGIGTTNPGVKLQVGDTNVGHDVYIAGSTTSQSGLFFYDGGIPGGMRYNFSTDDLSMFTAGTTRLMINSSGDVGIGVTNPSEDLDVAGTARLRGISSQVGATYVHVDSNGKLWKISSSRRYKTNIRDLEIDRDAIFHLRPVSFQCKTTGKEGIGLIAEEVQEHLPDLVIYDNEGGPRRLNTIDLLCIC